MADILSRLATQHLCEHGGCYGSVSKKRPVLGARSQQVRSLPWLLKFEGARLTFVVSHLSRNECASDDFFYSVYTGSRGWGGYMLKVILAGNPGAAFYSPVFS